MIAGERQDTSEPARRVEPSTPCTKQSCRPRHCAAAARTLDRTLRPPPQPPPPRRPTPAPPPPRPAPRGKVGPDARRGAGAPGKSAQMRASESTSSGLRPPFGKVREGPACEAPPFQGPVLAPTVSKLAAAEKAGWSGLGAAGSPALEAPAAAASSRSHSASAAPCATSQRHTLSQKGIEHTSSLGNVGQCARVASTP